MPWYAVESQLQRVGQQLIFYVNAPNRQNATDAEPGSTFLGGPYLSEAQAQKAFPGGSLGTVKPNKGAPAPTINANPQNPLGGLAAIGDFFQRLTQGATWERVGEVLLGGILLYAGVRALTHGTAAGRTASSARKTVSKPVKAAAKVAAPEVRLAGRVAAKKVAPKTTARVASHRAQVKNYGKPKPSPREPVRHTVTRTTHIYHHKGAKP